ncbi:uncharacterized protein LOC134005578 [Scomber scombrus]|uniref:uncharacterized protein LOC134005578 n=1 Tax=Scomber scombrus TaxID=13677 RepID=UPI002DDA0140|nr:uncharacterized protein LOC134005578 [Scomber scombrus]
MLPYMILCGLFYLSAVTESSVLTQDTGVISATVWDNVTLHCFYDSQVAMHFSWYRQTLGEGPQGLFTIYKYDKSPNVSHWSEKNPRFSVDMKEGMNHLHISNVQLSDSASYFCGISHSHKIEFGEGVFLSVKEVNHTEIIQEPSSETIRPGGSVMFNCTVQTGTCGAEHRVYWFRHGSRQGIVQTHVDQSKHVPMAQSPSKSCAYHFQKMNLSSSDAGTYYCAVASCGEILFGSGSKLLIKDDAEDPMAQIQILVWLSITRFGILLLFLAICLLVYISKRW